MKQILRLSIAGIALFAAACTDTVQPGMQQLATRRVASGHSTATEDPCTDCILGSVIGPVTLTRSTGAPVISTFEFPGDPSAGYILDIRDNGSRGLTGSVALNGDEIATTNAVGGTARISHP